MLNSQKNYQKKTYPIFLEVPSQLSSKTSKASHPEHFPPGRTPCRTIHVAQIRMHTHHSVIPLPTTSLPLVNQQRAGVESLLRTEPGCCEQVSLLRWGYIKYSNDNDPAVGNKIALKFIRSSNRNNSHVYEWLFVRECVWGSMFVCVWICVSMCESVSVRLWSLVEVSLLNGCVMHRCRAVRLVLRAQTECSPGWFWDFLKEEFCTLSIQDLALI